MAGESSSVRFEVRGPELTIRIVGCKPLVQEKRRARARVRRPPIWPRDSTSIAAHNWRWRCSRAWRI